MNQATIILEFIKAVEESDDLDYIELVLLSVTESPMIADFIKCVFRTVRGRRPLLLGLEEVQTA